MPNTLRWEDSIITDVSEGDESYFISTKSSICFGIAKKYGKVPKVGDHIRWGSKGLGSTIRAVFLNYEGVFVKSEKDIEREHQEWCDAEKIKKEKEFEKNKEKMDAEYEALPKVFQLRIDRFRAGNPRFRIEYEPYELFVCNEALKIAQHCKTPEAVKKFKEAPYEEQIKVIDGGHSGNTMGIAMRLAYHFLERPEMVVLEHGALVYLVGCEAYGCTHGDDFGKEAQ